MPFYAASYGLQCIMEAFIWLFLALCGCDGCGSVIFAGASFVQLPQLRHTELHLHLASHRELKHGFHVTKSNVPNAAKIMDNHRSISCKCPPEYRPRQMIDD